MLEPRLGRHDVCITIEEATLPRLFAGQPLLQASAELERDFESLSPIDFRPRIYVELFFSAKR